jgi:hypothetical protein
MVFGRNGPKLGQERRPGLQQLFLYSAFTLRFLATDFSTGTITVSLNHAFPISLHCTALIFGHSCSLSTYHYSFHSPCCCQPAVLRCIARSASPHSLYRYWASTHKAMRADAVLGVYTEGRQAGTVTIFGAESSHIFINWNYNMFNIIIQIIKYKEKIK